MVQVWDYVTSKHEWRRWDHRVVAEVGPCL